MSAPGQPLRSVVVAALSAVGLGGPWPRRAACRRCGCASATRPRRSWRPTKPPCRRSRAIRPRVRAADLRRARRPRVVAGSLTSRRRSARSARPREEPAALCSGVRLAPSGLLAIGAAATSAAAAGRYEPAACGAAVRAPVGPPCPQSPAPPSLHIDATPARLDFRNPASWRVARLRRGSGRLTRRRPLPRGLRPGCPTIAPGPRGRSRALLSR
jgi:hypothetical protein